MKIHKSLITSFGVNSRLFAYVCIFIFLFTGLSVVNAQETIDEEEVQLRLNRFDLKELIEPSVVRVIARIKGDVEVVPFSLDLVNLEIIKDDETKEDAPWQKIPIDKYIVGNGVVINDDGYVLVNAHLTSSRSVRLALVTPIADALFIDALEKLTEEELEVLSSREVSQEHSAAFSAEIIEFILNKSRFPAASSVSIITKDSAGKDFLTISSEGIFAIPAYANDKFYIDKKDFAFINSDIVEPLTLPIVELGSTTEVYFLQYPEVTDSDTELIYDSTLIKGVVRFDLSEKELPYIYFIETEREIDTRAGLGPLFNDTGQIIGMIVRPELDSSNKHTILSVVHTAPIIEKLSNYGVSGFDDSKYRDTMLAYFTALHSGDTEMATILLQQTGVSGDVVNTVISVDESKEVLVGPQYASNSLLDKITRITQKVSSVFSVNISEGGNANPLNIILLVGGGIMTLILISVILWVFLRLRHHKMQREELMSETATANTIPPSEFSMQTQENTPAQQKFVKEGVRTMNSDISITNEITNQVSETPKSIEVPAQKKEVISKPAPLAPTDKPDNTKSSDIPAVPLAPSDVVVEVVKADNIPMDEERLAKMWPDKYDDKKKNVDVNLSSKITTQTNVNTSKKENISTLEQETTKIFPEIVAYIRTTTEKGFSEKEIFDSLKTAGWNDVDIEKSFSFVKKTL